MTGAAAQSAPLPIRLRREAPDDDAFLIHLYGTTREWELEQLPQTPEQKLEFIRTQFQLQRTHYRRYYSKASFEVVLWNEQPAGRLYVLRQDHDIRIVDLAVLPEFRGRGIGSALLAGLIAEGAATSRPVSLHVEAQNPARRLYERHGFVEAAERGPFILLVRPPEA